MQDPNQLPADAPPTAVHVDEAPAIPAAGDASGDPTPERPPFAFTRRAGFTITDAVYEAIGAASVCWERMDGTGIFDSTRAKEIGDALLTEIRASVANQVFIHQQPEPQVRIVPVPYDPRTGPMRA